MIEDFYRLLHGKDRIVGVLLTILLSGAASSYSLAGSTSGSMQEERISVRGTVVDSNDQSPLPGVSIVVRGTSRGTTTDIEGNYQLEVEPGATLVFSFIGFVTQEVQVNGRSVIDIRMIQDVTALQEVVVVGYGELSEREVSTSLVSLESKDIERMPVYRAEQAIQGQAPGVVIMQQSGSPGSPLTIRVRGVTSAGNTEPLIIVDGLQVPNMEHLNPADIESISILKDAAATAIYGSRGGNGVLAVTTKSGQKNAKTTSVRFSSYVGAQNFGKEPDLLDTRGYAQYYNNSIDYMNEQGIPIPGAARGKFSEEEIANLPNTDWLDEVSESNALIQNYHLSLSGGGQTNSYYLSGGHFDQEGILGGEETRFRRTNLFFNYNQELGTRLNLRANVGYTLADRNYISENDENSSLLNDVTGTPPIYPALDRNGNLFNPGKPNPIVRGVPLNQSLEVNNPLLALKYGDNNAETQTIYTVLGVDWEIIEGLKFNSVISNLSADTDNRQFFARFNIPEQQFININNTLTQVTVDQWYRQWENYFNYNVDIGNSAIQSVLGVSVVESYVHQRVTNGSDFLGNSLDDVNFQLIIDPEVINVTESIDETGLLSFYGRVNYSFKDKYLLMASLRGDASSKFGAENRWGVFPAVSAGWILSEENFLNRAAWVNLLKLRASWGVNGNDAIPNYQYISNVSSGLNYPFGVPQETSNGKAPLTLANPEVRWEEVTQTNIGVDLNAFNNRLGVSVDFYNKVTSDMLLPVGVPLYVGASAPNINTAEVKNQGVEFLATYRSDATKAFTYHVNVNIGFNENEVTSLGQGDPIESANVKVLNASNASRTDVGHPIASFYGFVVEGLDEQGNLLYQDLTESGGITAEDRQFIGNPYPTTSYGFTLGAGFKGFDLNAFFQGVIGNDILNASYRHDFRYTNRPENVLNGWTSDNPNTNIVRPSALEANVNNEVSTYYLEDGSYMRLKNITLGYTLPEALTQSIKLANVRVYVMAQNLLTFTDYSGLDPEIGQGRDGVLDVGVDRGFYPQPRIIVGGIEIGL